MKRVPIAIAALLFAPPSIAHAAAGAFAGPVVAGIPIEFILFAVILLGVALFHHYTFPIAAIAFDGPVAQARVAVALAYVIGFFVMLAIIGWHPGSTPRGSVVDTVQQRV